MFDEMSFRYILTRFNIIYLQSNRSNTSFAIHAKRLQSAMILYSQSLHSFIIIITTRDTSWATKFLSYSTQIYAWIIRDRYNIIKYMKFSFTLIATYKSVYACVNYVYGFSVNDRPQSR